MSKIAFIFPGQGAQTTGMGQDFYQETETGREMFEKASEILGFSTCWCFNMKISRRRRFSHSAASTGDA